MDWIIIGLVVLIIGSLLMNYFNYVEIRNLRKFNEYQTSCIDTINKRLRDNEYTIRDNEYTIHGKLASISDNLKYNYFTGKVVTEMWDVHNARLNSYFENLTRNHEELISYRNVLRRLEPIAILADKFDIKRKLKYSSEHTNDLKSDLKEIERELKDLA
jgi:hypothetical protein